MKINEEKLIDIAIHFPRGVLQSNCNLVSMKTVNVGHMLGANNKVLSSYFFCHPVKTILRPEYYEI